MPAAKKSAPKDPVKAYEKALSLIDKKDYSKAKKALSGVAEKADSPELSARAKMLIRLCERQLDDITKPGTKADAEELFDYGVFEHNRGNYKAAQKHFQGALKKDKKADYVYYALAASAALQKEEKEAISNLEKAIKMKPENRYHAANDPDFKPLAENEKFQDLIEG